jgi:hypothetical protein
MSSFSEWQAFWRTYTDQHNDVPLLLRSNEHPGLPVTADGIFRATVRMSDHLRSLSTSKRAAFSRIRFYIDGVRLEDPVDFLMRTEDRDFIGWHNRLIERVKDYCIIFTHLEATFAEDIAGIYDVLRPLVNELGIPAKKSEVTLFAGRYKKTPFGIHTDNELNFYWPIIGPKRIRFWRPEYGRSIAGFAGLTDYHRHVSESVLLDGGAGDMMVWPGEWWHIAEGSAEFSASLTIPLAWYPLDEKASSQDLVQKIARIILPITAARARATLLPLRQNEDGAESVPEMVTDASQVFSRIQPADLADYLVEQWLRKLTTCGLALTGSLRSDFVLTETDLVRCANRMPIRWARLSRNRICAANGGNSVVLPESPTVVELFAQLNTLATFRVGDLAEQIGQRCGGAPSTVTKFLLTMLGRAGTVVLENETN